MSTTLKFAERAATLITLILVFGAAIFRVRVAQPLYRVAAPDETDFANKLFTRCVQTGAIAGMVLMLLAFARLHLQVTALFDTWHDVGRAQIATLLFHSVWGYGWLLQLTASLVLALSPFVSPRPLDSWMAVPLAVSASLSGHAASVRGITPLTVAMDSLHILAAGGWVGGIFFLLSSFRLGNSAEVLRAVRGFNSVALTCAAIVVGTGVFAAFVHIPSFFALTSSPYGTALIFKLVFVGLMLLAGAWNWKRGTPALAAGDDRAIRRGIAREMVFALGILLVTARLVGLAPPMMEH